MQLPRVECFIMAEDIRLERQGQFTIVGAFSDRIFTKLWPLQLAKLCFQIRVRGLEGTPKHRLELVKQDSDQPLASLGGETKQGDEQVNFFNYFFSPSPELADPGAYVAKFVLGEDQEPVLKAEYRFRLENPNPDELYVKCGRCGARYGTGMVVKGDGVIAECGSVCARCGHTNLLDSATAFRLPNPA